MILIFLIENRAHQIGNILLDTARPFRLLVVRGLVDVIKYVPMKYAADIIFDIISESKLDDRGGRRRREKEEEEGGGGGGRRRREKEEGEEIIK